MAWARARSISGCIGGAPWDGEAVLARGVTSGGGMATGPCAAHPHSDWTAIQSDSWGENGAQQPGVLEGGSSANPWGLRVAKRPLEENPAVTLCTAEVQLADLSSSTTRRGRRTGSSSPPGVAPAVSRVRECFGSRLTRSPPGRRERATSNSDRSQAVAIPASDTQSFAGMSLSVATMTACTISPWKVGSSIPTIATRLAGCRRAHRRPWFGMGRSKEVTQ